MKLIAAMLLVSSCALVNDLGNFNTPRKSAPSEPQKTLVNKDLWLGKDVEELDLHPVFATLKMENRKSASGIIVRTYKNDSGGIDEKGRVNQYSGEITRNSKDVSCNHVFYIKDNKITDYVRVGAHCTIVESGLFSPVPTEG